jgi:hypothetical protein
LTAKLERMQKRDMELCYRAKVLSEDEYQRLRRECSPMSPQTLQDYAKQMWTSWYQSAPPLPSSSNADQEAPVDSPSPMSPQSLQDYGRRLRMAWYQTAPPLVLNPTGTGTAGTGTGTGTPTTPTPTPTATPNPDQARRSERKSRAKAIVVEQEALWMAKHKRSFTPQQLAEQFELAQLVMTPGTPLSPPTPPPTTTVARKLTF